MPRSRTSSAHAVDVILPPWIGDPSGRWLSVPAFAREFNRDRRTIFRWCKTGYVHSLGFRTYQDVTRRWWIRIPIS